MRLAVATGHEELARTVTGELEEGARRSPANSAAAAALLCRSLVERDPAPALDAVTLYRQTPLRPALAACCEHTAALLAPLGRRNEAIALLNDAAAIHADTDAIADALASTAPSANSAPAATASPRRAPPSAGNH